MANDKNFKVKNGLDVSGNITQNSNAVLDTSDVGTGANQLVQLDANSKLPAVDGSQLINLPESFADPMTSRGDFIYRNSSNNTDRLGLGSNLTVIASNGTDASWTSLTKAHISDFSDGDYLSSSLSVLEDSDFSSEGLMYRNASSGSYSIKTIGTTSGTIAAGDHNHTGTYALISGSTGQDFNTNNLTVQGNLTVNGTTTTVNSTIVSVDDKNIELGSVDTPTDTTADGGGITLRGTTDKTITWQNSDDSWHFNQGIDITGNIVVSGTVDGRNVATDGSKLDGIESNATADQTAQEIANLIDADTTAESTLKSALALNNVENTALSTWVGTSNLTTVGTITSGVWNGTAIADSYISSASTWNSKQDALTFGIADNNAVAIDSTSITSGEYAKFTTTGLESKSIAEVQSDLGLGTAAYTSSTAYDAAGAATSAVSSHESTYDHSTYIQDADFTSQGLMYRNSSSGSYTTKVIGSDIQEFVDIKVLTLSTSSTAAAITSLFSTSTYSSAKLIIQAIDNSSGYTHVCELLVTSDGTNFNATQYGSVYTGVGELATYDVIDGSGACSLEISPASSNSTSYVIHVTSL